MRYGREQEDVRALNRTLLELKLFRYKKRNTTRRALNRTLLELKL